LTKKQQALYTQFSLKQHNTLFHILYVAQIGMINVYFITA